jgi:hypothetical protein
MAAYLLSNGGASLTGPTGDNHLCSLNDRHGGMATASQFVNGCFFSCILCWTCLEQFRHPTPPLDILFLYLYLI